jgi:hypothetical protein
VARWPALPSRSIRASSLSSATSAGAPSTICSSTTDSSFTAISTGLPPAASHDSEMRCSGPASDRSATTTIASPGAGIAASAPASLRLQPALAAASSANSSQADDLFGVLYGIGTSPHSAR